MTTTDSVASLAVPEWSQVRMHRKLWFVAILWILFVLTALANVLASLLFLVPSLWLIWSGPIYSRKKGATVVQSKRNKVLMTVMAVVVLGWGIFQQGGGMAQLSSAYALPTCESSAAKTALRDAVHNSPRAKRTGLEVQDVMGAGPSKMAMALNNGVASRLDSDGQAITHLCEAIILTNGGRSEVLYSIEWVDKAKQRWYVEAKL